MMKTIIGILTCLFFSLSVQAQDKVAVENAVRDYVDGFYYGDTLKIKNSISPTVFKHGFYRPKDKTTYEADTMTYQPCIELAASGKKRDAPWVRHAYAACMGVGAAKLLATRTGAPAPAAQPRRGNQQHQYCALHP